MKTILALLILVSPHAYSKELIRNLCARFLYTGKYFEYADSWIEYRIDALEAKRTWDAASPEEIIELKELKRERTWRDLEVK